MISSLNHNNLIVVYLSSSSSSSCHTTSTDIPDTLSPLLPIVHCFQQVFRATSHVSTELLYVGSSWSSYFARPCEGVRWSTSLMSSSLLLQQCPGCLVCLILIVFIMGGRWPYSCCFERCCLLVNHGNIMKKANCSRIFVWTRVLNQYSVQFMNNDVNINFSREIIIKC